MDHDLISRLFASEILDNYIFVYILFLALCSLLCVHSGCYSGRSSDGGAIWLEKGIVFLYFCLRNIIIRFCLCNYVFLALLIVHSIRLKLSNRKQKDQRDIRPIVAEK